MFVKTNLQLLTRARLKPTGARRESAIPSNQRNGLSAGTDIPASFCGRRSTTIRRRARYRDVTAMGRDGQGEVQIARRACSSVVPRAICERSTERKASRIDSLKRTRAARIAIPPHESADP